MTDEPHTKPPTDGALTEQQLDAVAGGAATCAHGSTTSHRWTDASGVSHSCPGPATYDLP